jgi:arsenate reductase (thioredoxin)
MITVLIILSAMLFPEVGNSESKNLVDKTTVVFVCEHGSAKSVVAAAYFNHVAQQMALSLRAISRGTNPDPDISPSVIEGLRKDQISLPADKPAKLTSAEASSALKVISFCELPHAINTQNVERWEVPPISEDYSKSRDAIVKKINELIQVLKTK